MHPDCEAASAATSKATGQRLLRAAGDEAWMDEVMTVLLKSYPDKRISTSKVDIRPARIASLRQWTNEARPRKPRCAALVFVM